MWTENWLNYLVQRSVTWSPAGGQSPAWRPRAQYWIWYCLISSLTTWMMGLSASPASLQRAQSCEECFIDNIVVLPFRETSTHWRNGQMGALRSSKRQVHLGRRKLHAPIYAAGPQTGDLFCRKGSGRSGEQEGDHEPTKCSYGKGSQ